jgi:phenylalanyl-tRNA synthetase alpha chain
LWEILGAGMISPKVLTLNNIDPEQKTGLAFGIGVERIAMLKYGIKNIRDFYENDVRFLKQFKFFGE